jgi:hypothetical protein
VTEPRWSRARRILIRRSSSRLRVRAAGRPACRSQVALGTPPAARSG